MKNKKDNSLNVFTFTTYKKPWHIIYNIKSFLRNIKFAIQRIKYGYCDYDRWDIDVWFSSIFPNMIEEHIIKNNSYHCIEGYENRTEQENIEIWNNELHKLADGFHAQLIDYCDINKKYAKFLEESPITEQEKQKLSDYDKRQLAIIHSNFLEGERNFEKHKAEILHNSITLFEKYYHYLWE